MPGNPALPDAIGEPVSEPDEFWLETARTPVSESVASFTCSGTLQMSPSSSWDRG
ncbi:MAG: hypothetical protein A4E49_01320 [Methanosaeta sp. PtaU1.Bin112]|nr:MAG: hypothetical protein A4E49_01320 [Methanosaeta sp. PtaU1.Bin112]